MGAWQELMKLPRLQTCCHACKNLLYKSIQENRFYYNYICTEAQARWLALLGRVPGVEARVVRPQDLGTIEAWLRGDQEAESR